jgi:GTP-sensing pleiotropic transcriptional regulator CodY
VSEKAGWRKPGEENQPMNDSAKITDPSASPISWDAITARTKVYVASTRLQQSADQAEALEAVLDITANLLGSEELALYKVDATRQSLWLYWSFGIDPNRYSVLDVAEHPKLAEVLAGNIILRHAKSEETLLSENDSVSGIVPIVVNGAAVGALIIFRMLPHKGKFDAADREICKVLSNCAGRAIEPKREQQSSIDERECT